MENSKILKLIATYSRVSTATQEEQQTIQTQIGVLKEYAEKNSYTIVSEYVDDGWSGDMLARPALDQLRQDAKSKKWEAVLIYDPDRLARRYSYQELVMDELKEAGIEIIFVTVDAPKNSEDKILHGVRGLFSEYERAKISERFRLGKLRKVKEGHILVSDALYGYKYVPKKDKVHGYYEIREDEAQVVRMIFKLVSEDGLTIRGVIKRLQQLEIKPRKSKRGVWSTSTLSTMLRNKAYIGEARWGSSYAVVPDNPTNLQKYKRMKKSSRRSKPEEEWIIIPVPAIITRDTYNKTQEKVSKSASFSQRNKKNEYLLAGNIYCPCGRKRTGEGPLKGKHLYYRCTDRVCNYPLPATCKEKALNARIADALVWERVTQLMSSPDLLYRHAERWAKAKSQDTESSFKDTDFITKEIEKLEDQEGRYVQAYGSGMFTMDQLKIYVDPIRDKIKGLKSELSSQLQDKTLVTGVLPTPEEIKTFAAESAELLKNLSFNTKRGIILSTIDKVIGTKKELQVYGHIPVTSNINVITINRRRRPPQRGQINIIQRTDQELGSC